LGHVIGVGAVMSAVSLFAGPALATAATAQTTSGDGFDATGIAQKVDPSIVDINTTLSDGAAAGTGVVLTSSGLVLTNNHVIDGATSIQVQVDGTGPSYSADVVGYDATDDVAVIQMNGVSGLQPAPIGDSSSVQVDDEVLALGNALGRGGAPQPALGTVTGLDKTITASDETGANPETLNGTIEHDAAIQPGDSGGPLVDANGDVVGINSAGASSNGGSGGFNAFPGFGGVGSGSGSGSGSTSGSGNASGTDAYAIPINSALAIAKEINDGQASDTVHIGSRAILGVEVGGDSASSGTSSGGFGSGGFGSGGFGSGGRGSGRSSGGFGSSGFGSGGVGSGNASGAPSTASNGVQIAGVASGGPAEAAGLVAGDTITAIDGHSLSSTDDISSVLDGHQPGDHVSVTWTDGNGQQHTATATLAAGPPA
jgi:S1-C subfamily serine protease